MWDWVDKVGTLIGIISAMIAAWNAWKLRRETKHEWGKANEPIRVMLRPTSDHGAKEYILPVELPRGALTRSEVLGLIGMIPMKNKGNRFQVGFFNTKGFSDELSRLRDAEGEFDLVIPCLPEEIEQFNVNDSEKLHAC